MEAPNFSSPESLDVLTSTLNKTLVETGQFFRSGGSLQSRAQLKRAIPTAHEKFQYALDQLSEQIFIAKAFLERDYEVIKAKKAAICPVEEAVVSEPDIKAEPEPSPLPEQPDQPAGDLDINENESKQAENETATAGQADMNFNQDLPENPDGEEKTQEPTSALPPTQMFSGTDDMNFDSMLKDSGGGPNEFDLNLDFGEDNDTGNEDFLSGANFGTTNTHLNIEGGNQQNENINTGSMQTGGDAFDLELQRTEAYSGNMDGLLDGQVANLDDAMVGESSFDDLFVGNENMDGDDTRLLDVNEIDNWFA